MTTPRSEPADALPVVSRLVGTADPIATAGAASPPGPSAPLLGGPSAPLGLGGRERAPTTGPTDRHRRHPATPALQREPVERVERRSREPRRPGDHRPVHPGAGSAVPGDRQSRGGPSCGGQSCGGRTAAVHAPPVRHPGSSRSARPGRLGRAGGPPRRRLTPARQCSAPSRPPSGPAPSPSTTPSGLSVATTGSPSTPLGWPSAQRRGPGGRAPLSLLPEPPVLARRSPDGPTAPPPPTSQHRPGTPSRAPVPDVGDRSRRPRCRSPPHRHGARTSFRSSPAARPPSSSVRAPPRCWVQRRTPPSAALSRAR